MMLGGYALGAAVPLGAIGDGDGAADYDPYAGLYDMPEGEQILLVELQIRQDPE